MKKISFDRLQPRAPQPNELVARNAKEALINEIVEHCHPAGKRKQIAKLLALAANTAGWTETELHALLQKRHDPTIRNYSAFVVWSAKVRNSP